MKIGITYDLRDYYLACGMNEEDTAEFDRMDTISAIDGALRDLGYETDPVGNVRQLASRLLSGDRWDLVFNIAEGLNGFGREAQVPALLDAYGIPYTFSDPLVLSLTLHKAMTKRVVRDMGIPTPEFFVVETQSDLDNVDMPFPLFAKPLAEGTGKGVTADSKIRNRKQLVSVCTHLLGAYKQPVLIEAFLPGREFTVGILGTGEDARSIGAMEVVLNKDADPGVYSYRNKEECESLVEYRWADDALAVMAQDIALAAHRGLGCKDASRVDLRADTDGKVNFMEINPLAGLHPEHSDLCILATMASVGYKELIEMIMDSAMKRYYPEKKHETWMESRHSVQRTSAFRTGVF